MFGIWNRKRPIVHEWWHAVLLDFEASVSEFYDAIECDLKAREVQGLELSRVEYGEGSLLSAKRTYLRMRRERIIMDVCSAPFGTSWLFSFRFSEVRVCVTARGLGVLFLLLAGFWYSYVQLFGFTTGNIIFGSTIFGSLLLMVSAVPLGFHDMDAALLQIPVVGGVYELLFRPDTYYRQDTRVAYATIIDSVVRDRVSAVARARGVEKVQFVKLNVPEEQPSLIGRLLGYFRGAKHADREPHS
jgi:hypothetical protein